VILSLSLAIGDANCIWLYTFKTFQTCQGLREEVVEKRRQWCSWLCIIIRLCDSNNNNNEYFIHGRIALFTMFALVQLRRTHVFNARVYRNVLLINVINYTV